MPVNLYCPPPNHRHKYTFRLMYCICTNNAVVTDDKEMIHLYQEARNCVHRIKTSANTIQGFFLLPERLSWIIEPYTRALCKQDTIKPPDSGQDIGKTYKFRLVYVICTDGAAIKPDVQMTTAYQDREQAEPLIKNRSTHWLWEDKTKPVPKREVQGFYLVPEKLWWILAPFAKQFLIKDRMLLSGR